ncbi:MBL fold metallo-hydrolase [Halorubrum sp. JWXQ-INN 858]|uniref:MBL fold metallo-hydrolase n=1 Tax=Halorubrum sp. JWXQ-INN 858 TaxID=2690782 RepID=UPI00135B49C3|nr:MBL fold metallo-hydrolase [Halorubrum sp. JWXQ-INN 858]MWV63853.1 MBL fold metallo-hydrolase [Halorubrum sp. JWXQ-INN 858]
MPTEIAPDVYDITCAERDGKRFRVFLLTAGTPTLFDAGLADTVDAVADGIESVGVEPERLVVTHGDGDHVGGFDGVVDRYDLETWVPAETDLDADHEPDHRYGDGDRIGRFRAVHVPGHKPDNHALIDADAGVAVLGDAVSGADQRGLPAGYFHLPPAVYSRDLNEAEENLDRLLTYEFDVGLVYHGSSVTEGARDTLDRYVNFPGKPT